jgi:hypothetical protein
LIEEATNIQIEEAENKQIDEYLEGLYGSVEKQIIEEDKQEA